MEQQFRSLIPTFFVSFLIFMLLKLWRRRLKSNHSTTPPGPTKLPIIGNMHQLMGSLPHHRLRDLANQHGGIMHLQLGEVSSIVISSPEAAKQVLKTHDIIFSQRPFQLAASLITYNYTDVLFAPYSDYWRQAKKICTLELLTAKRVRSFRSIREEEVSNLVSTITSFSGQPFNFSKNLFALTNDITTRATFGKKCKDKEEIIELFKRIAEAAGGFSLVDYFPSMKFLHAMSGMKSKLLRLREEEDRILDEIIKDHRVTRMKGKSSSDESEEEEHGDDLVDVLLRVQENGDYLEFPLTTDNIKAIILDIFVGGTDTSSTTLEWAMAELLKSPRTMEKAQTEVRKVFGEKAKVDETCLHELNYLKLIIKETLRLHPPAPIRSRECRERCQINGYDIPAKTKIIVNAWALARDPNHWTEPETFYPERFLHSSIDYNGNNFGYIPFGAGRRICPGILSGLANIELPLAYLLYHFDWKLADGLKAESLDMTEIFGATVRRKNDLYLMAIPHHPI